MSEKIWQKVAKLVAKASINPLLQANETLIEFLKTLINEEQAKFITNFRKPILTFDQLKEKSGMTDRDLMEMLNSIMHNGVIMDIPNETSGVLEYHLMGPFPSIWEFSLIQKGSLEKKRRIALIHEKMTVEASEQTQKNYEGIQPLFRTQFPPLTRTVPVEETIRVPIEETLPIYKASELIDKQDIISLSECPCKLDKKLVGEPCKTTDERLRCFHFGNTGRFFIEHGFGEPVSKEKANDILKAAEKDGLVHKIFHYDLDADKHEEALCNCCKCCCIVFQDYYRGVWPFHTITSNRARLNSSKCEGCGTCVEKCPIEAISLIDGKSHDDETKCIGCGVCVYHCPEIARNLEPTGVRKVYIPPPKKIEIN
ncbi:hypothetical protein LCGC14_0482090 [marine sediment metagenome]|uniref:4Fe-4S ferredoxin-type domain-containing protein n=1 Tax=marine sediment metagenome TaxID=412755 RepID=A0A0F9UW43_9ZZZZ|nr:MAG: Anaerobic sulfite reductase subunit C [Candidatus Lokiarchaeum sp. GC14_75]